MNSQTATSGSPSARLDYLDATRAFALLLGVVFHASLSFVSSFMGWAVQDISTSPLVNGFVTVSHSFRMELFFLLAGFFACVTLRRTSIAEFVRARALRILPPFLIGWFLLRPLLISGWLMGSASLRGDFEFWPAILAGFQSLKTLAAGIFTGSHLWFLYYLAMITGLAVALRATLGMAPAWNARVMAASDRVVGWAANSGWTLPALALPTAAALWYMRYWGMDTPDQSLVPSLPVLTIYGGFFLLGWALGRREGAIERIARLSPARCIAAAAGIAGVLWLAPVQSQPSHEHYTAAHVGFVASYAVMMWSLVLLTMGVFRILCDRPRAWVRYVADASYWIYLVHLPTVVWLQVACAELPLSWAVKLIGISAVTVGLALLTYDLFVRSTWLGAVLNGRRRERVIFGWATGRVPAIQREAATPESVAVPTR
ncbi:MAG: acyltransferase family protein [Opitutus sp.]